MPLDGVEADLPTGKLVRLTIDDPAPSVRIMTLAAVYPTATPPGPAGRLLIERLQREAAPDSDAVMATPT